MSRCKGCDAEIEWVKTTTGKRIPVDVAPVCVVVTSGGPLKVVLDSGNVVSARLCVEGDAEHEGTNVVEARTSHFATCRDADKFRSKATPA